MEANLNIHGNFKQEEIGKILSKYTDHNTDDPYFTLA